MLAAFNSVAVSTLSWKQFAHLQLVPHLTVYHQVSCKINLKSYEISDDSLFAVLEDPDALLLL